MPEKPKTHRPNGSNPGYDKQRERARAKRRGSTLYKKARWQRLRKMVLARDPLCVECLKVGRTVASTHVDHIVALKNGGTNSMDNLQGLCASCHSRKTATEDGGFGR